VKSIRPVKYLRNFAVVYRSKQRTLKIPSLVGSYAVYLDKYEPTFPKNHSTFFSSVKQAKKRVLGGGDEGTNDPFETSINIQIHNVISQKTCVFVNSAVVTPKRVSFKPYRIIVFVILNR
jgi:hypothetical protein